jgi:hypothetical protein
MLFLQEIGGFYMAKSENSKTLLDFGNVSDEDIQEYFDSIFVAQQANAEVKSIFSVALKNKELFPNINLFSGSTYTDYIDRWLKGYIYADSNPPHLRVVSPKSSCSDPAIKSVVKIATNLSDEDAERQESHHNLFMSAENIQGQLLEEYISVAVVEHGWLWCKGNTMHERLCHYMLGLYLVYLVNHNYESPPLARNS